MTEDQRAKWKQALAELHRQQRQRRGRRRGLDASNPRPGMIRIRGDDSTSTEDQTDTDGGPATRPPRPSDHRGTPTTLDGSDLRQCPRRVAAILRRPLVTPESPRPFPASEPFAIPGGTIGT